jgi:voltage-gated potassium channel
MLSPYSQTIQAKFYRNFIGLLILVNVATYILSTYPDLDSRYDGVFDLVEAATSYVFLVDYILRVFTAPESRQFSRVGSCQARLKWMFSFSGLLDAAATFPYFLDTFLTHNVLPSLTWLRIFRICAIFRTNKYANAAETVIRILTVNREILTVSLFLVMFMLLFTSAMLWSIASEEIAAANNITDVPSTMFLAVLMLTGQGAPEGDLTMEMKLVVMMTAFLSVPFFAVPAAMLTWGFEGEAQRLASREQRSYHRNKLYSKELNETLENMDTASSGDDDSEFEEYLQGVGGADEADEELQEDALSFFEALSTKQSGANNKGCSQSEMLLSQAWQKSRELTSRHDESIEHNTLKNDAMMLLQWVGAFGPNGPRDPLQRERVQEQIRIFGERVGLASKEKGETEEKSESISRKSDDVLCSQIDKLTKNMKILMENQSRMMADISELKGRIK